MAYIELASEALDGLDHLLARVIGGMGLAGEHELHRSLRIEEEAP